MNDSIFFVAASQPLPLTRVEQVLCCDYLRDANSPVPVLGCEQGTIRLYRNNKSAEVLRSGGDAAIQALTVTQNGVIMATDNESNLSVFVESHLIERRKLSGTVSCLNVEELSGGNSIVMSADWSGTICGFDSATGESLWRSSVGSGVFSGGMVSACLGQHRTGERLAYYSVVAPLAQQRLLLLSMGEVVASIPTPEQIHAMCVGCFIDPHDAHEGLDVDDVALAGDDGMLYVLHQHQVVRFAQVGFVLSAIATVSIRNSSLDAIVCIGSFPGWKLFHGASFVCESGCSQWLRCIASRTHSQEESDTAAEILGVSLDNDVRCWTVALSDERSCT